MPSARPEPASSPARSDSIAPDLQALTERLRERMGELVGPGAERDRYGIAVSGGPDSMALLALMHSAFPGQVEAATVDHQLRPESGQEAAMVADWCASRAIPHVILAPASPITGSLQAAAREARYQLLENWRQERGLDWLLTAHHADDQAETLLMRLNRGSGVSGLAGVRARNGRLLRPLLDWRRSELGSIAEQLALPVVHDPSNIDPRFDRVAMRQKLAQADWIDPLAVSRSASAMAEAGQALDWMVDRFAHDHLSRDENGTVRLDRTDLPREIMRRLVLQMLQLADPDVSPPRGETLDQALVQLYAGRKTMIGNLLLQGGMLWTACPAPPRKKGG